MRGLSAKDGVRRRELVVAALLGAALLGLMVCSARASAEVGAPAGTVQQTAADALFLQYAPAPPVPGVICLVDSGVDPNPDTTPILAGSYALSPNTNTEDELAALNPPLPGGHPDGHGTYMAMIAAAPANGWGMVGLAPTSVRIFNMKALAAGQTTFAFSEYGSAISACQALTATMPVSVVNLSLGSATQPTGEEREELEDLRTAQRTKPVSASSRRSAMKAARCRRPPTWKGCWALAPLTRTRRTSARSVPSATAAPGSPCSLRAAESGATGPAGAGNGIEIAFSDDGVPAWAEGTSEAAVIVSAVEASMRAYSPTLSYSKAQGCITSTLANGGSLDVAAAFNACGLGAGRQRGHGRVPSGKSGAHPAEQHGSVRGDSVPGAAGPAAGAGDHQDRLQAPRPGDHRRRHPQGSAPTTGRAGARQVRQARHARAGGHDGHRTSTLHVNRWDRVVARFLSGATKLPELIVTRAVHGKHTGGRKRIVR